MCIRVCALFSLVFIRIDKEDFFILLSLLHLLLNKVIIMSVSRPPTVDIQILAFNEHGKKMSFVGFEFSNIRTQRRNGSSINYGSFVILACTHSRKRKKAAGVRDMLT